MALLGFLPSGSNSLTKTTDAIAAATAPIPGVNFVTSIGTTVAHVFSGLIHTPGPGKIWQQQCQQAGFRWDPKAWGMTGHCIVPDWNDALALMKASGDIRVCVSLIPTKSGICPNVCSHDAGTKKSGPAVKYAPTAAYAHSGGNCATVKADNGTYVPTKKNPAPSLDDIDHITAVLKQGGTAADLSSDQRAVAAQSGLIQGDLFNLSSIFGANSTGLIIVAGAVAVGSLIFALRKS